MGASVSNTALNWAFEQVLKPSEKFILVALANWADKFGLVWRDTKHLRGDTCQNRKTILAGTARLASLKLISDSGRRAGQTKSIVVWQLALPDRKRSQKGDTFQPGKNSRAVPVLRGSSPENGHRDGAAYITSTHKIRRTSTRVGETRSEEATEGAARKPVRLTPDEAEFMALCREVFGLDEMHQNYRSWLKRYRSEIHTRRKWNRAVLDVREILKNPNHGIENPAAYATRLFTSVFA